MNKRHHLRNLRSSGAGFSVIELLMTVVVLGIVSAVVINASGSEWRRERVNTVAIELAAWLEAIRESSQRLGAAGTTGCTVTFNTTPAIKQAGDEIARVTPPECAPTSPVSANNSNARALLLTAFADGPDRYTVAPTFASPTAFSFTPRGSMSDSSGGLKILLNGTTLMRCVRVANTLGRIQISSNNSAANMSQNCSSSNLNTM